MDSSPKRCHTRAHPPGRPAFDIPIGIPRRAVPSSRPRGAAPAGTPVPCRRRWREHLTSSPGLRSPVELLEQRLCWLAFRPRAPRVRLLNPQISPLTAWRCRAGQRKPSPTLSTSRESCPMRWLVPKPCMGPCSIVLSMRKSAVPRRTSEALDEAMACCRSVLDRRIPSTPQPDTRPHTVVLIQILHRHPPSRSRQEASNPGADEVVATYRQTDTPRVCYFARHPFERLEPAPSCPSLRITSFTSGSSIRPASVAGRRGCCRIQDR